MNDIPLWATLSMHVAPLIAALAAWRSAARGGKVSRHNGEVLGAVYLQVNGNLTALQAELAAVKGELEEMRRRDG